MDDGSHGAEHPRRSPAERVDQANAIELANLTPQGVHGVARQASTMSRLIAKRARSAPEGTRTPNLLIRSPFQTILIFSENPRRGRWRHCICWAASRRLVSASGGSCWMVCGLFADFLRTEPRSLAAFDYFLPSPPCPARLNQQPNAPSEDQQLYCQRSRPDHRQAHCNALRTALYCR